MTQKEGLHMILLSAKERIKDGVLYDYYGEKCVGLCQFVAFGNRKDNYCPTLLAVYLNEFDKDFLWDEPYGKPYDFSDPKRLALLDWLIERTAP